MLLLVIVDGTVASEALLFGLAQVKNLFVELDGRLRVRDFTECEFRKTDLLTHSWRMLTSVSASLIASSILG